MRAAVILGRSAAESMPSGDDGDAVEVGAEADVVDAGDFGDVVDVVDQQDMSGGRGILAAHCLSIASVIS